MAQPFVVLFVALALAGAPLRASPLKSFEPDVPAGEVIPDVAERLRQVPLADSPEHKMMWLGPVAFSPDERLVATGSDDLVIHLWEHPAGKPAGEIIGHESFIMNFDFSSDGRLMASASVDSTAHLWDVATRKELARLRGHTGWVGEARFHPRDEALFTAAADGNLIVWSVPAGQRQKMWRAHQDAIWSARWSPDGGRIATGSVDKTVALWEYPSGQLLRRFEGFVGEVRMVRFSPDGARLAVVSDNAPIRTFSVDTGEELQPFQASPRAPFTSVAFSPDGRQVVAGSYDRRIYAWDAATALPLGSWEGHRSHIRQMDFSPSGRFFASTSGETIVHEVAAGASPADGSFVWAQQARMSGIWISYNRENRVWREDDGTFLGTPSVKVVSQEPPPEAPGETTDAQANITMLYGLAAAALALAIGGIAFSRRRKKS